MAEIPPPTFLSIVQLHHLQAMLQLGIIENPLTGKRNPMNRELAKRELQLLEILHLKTAGNLDADEEELLTGAIFAIRQALGEGTANQE